MRRVTNSLRAQVLLGIFSALLVSFLGAVVLLAIVNLFRRGSVR